MYQPYPGLLDLSDLTLEVQGELVKEDGTKFAPADNVILSNNSLHSFIKTVTVVANGTQIEFNNYYSLNSYIKQIIGFRSHDISQKGTLIGMHELGFNPVEFTDASFANIPEDVKKRMEKVKQDGFVFKGPLMIDLASVTSYLVNGIQLQLKIELQEPTYYIGSPNLTPKIRLSSIKLFSRVAKLRQNMGLATEKSIMRGPLVYNFKKFVGKTYVIPARQTQLSIESPFLGSIPHRLFAVMIDHSSFVGSSFKTNPQFFRHNDLKRVSITVNDTYRYNLTSQFTSDTTGLYYECLKAIGGDDDHLLSRDAFENGSTLLVFNLSPELLKEALHINKSGVLRMNIELGTPTDQNISLYLLGEFQSFMRVFSDRSISIHNT